MKIEKVKLKIWTSKIYAFLTGLFEEEDEEEVFRDLTALYNALALIQLYFDREKIVWNLLKLIDLMNIFFLLFSAFHSNVEHWYILPWINFQGLRYLIFELLSFSFEA